MSFQYPALTWGTSTSSGTGTINISGTGPNTRPWATTFSVATLVYYVIKGATYYEEGLGSFDPGSGDLTRVVVLFSSNSGSLVDLPVATTHDVYVTYPGEPAFFDSFSGNHTLSVADHGNVQQFTGSGASTLTLPAVADVPPGFKVPVFNDGTAALTLDADGAETIEGATTQKLQPGEAGFLHIDVAGTQWRFKRLARMGVDTIASAATVDLAKAKGNVVHISGNTGPITSFGSPQAGAEFTIVCDSTPVISAGGNILTPGSADYQTVANACFRIVSEGAGVVRIVAATHGGGVATMGKVTIASAATVDLTKITASLVHISGNTGPITSFGSPPAGAEFRIVCDSTPTFQASANLLTPGSATINAAADVSLDLVSEGGGVVRVTNITSGSGVGWAWNSGNTLALGNNAWNHSLGVHPRKAMVRAAIVCTSTDAGYSVGDVVDLFSNHPDNANHMITLANDSDGNTSRVIVNGGVHVAHKSTFANTAVTLANWTLYIGVQLEF